MRTRARGICVVGACATVSWAAGAQPVGEVLPPAGPEAAPPDSIRAYVDLLDADDYAARQSAADFIYQTPMVGLETVEPWLIDASLEPEARSRLEAIGEMLFRVSPRAAMCVQFERQGVAPIIIRNAVPDEMGYFRAHEVIEAGDEVVLADGAAVETYDEFQAAILAHDPYEVMRLRVRRGGNLVDLEVRLGDFNRLPSPNLPADHIMRMAWEKRLARIQSAASGPLRPRVDLRGLAGRAGAAGLEGELPARVRGALVLAGGMSRGGIDQSGEPLEAAPLELDGLAVEVRDYLRQQGLAEQQVREVERQLEPLLERHRQLTDLRARVRENIELTQSRLDAEDLDPAQRRALEEGLMRLRQTLAEAQAQIDAISNVLPLGR